MYDHRWDFSIFKSHRFTKGPGTGRLTRTRAAAVLFVLGRKWMNKIIATMSVKAELKVVRNIIAGHIRDGVIFRPSTNGTPGYTVSLELQECERLEDETRRMWTVGNCAILAEYATNELTTLKLLAVKGILYNNGAAEHDWKFLESEFKKARLLLNSESVSKRDTGDIASVLIERDLIEKSRPESEGEQKYKNQRRESLNVSQTINKGLPNQHTLNDDEIEVWVNEDWESYTRHIEEQQARWDEIHSFIGMTTEQATEQYLMQDVQVKPTTNQAVARQNDLHVKKGDLSVNRAVEFTEEQMDNRRKFAIGLLAFIAFAVPAFILTLLANLGKLPWELAMGLNALVLASVGAATFLGALNNIISLAEKLSGNKTTKQAGKTWSNSQPKAGETIDSTVPMNIAAVSSTFTCFMAHSHEDEVFAAKLYADLKSHGIKAWRFEEDAKWGETVWGEIDRSIKKYDKLVVVLSENSLQSKPVLREIQRSLDREDKEHKNILFPITLDRYVFDKWEYERKVDVMEKVVGDFIGWDTDAAKYSKAFEKLLRGLQAEKEYKIEDDSTPEEEAKVHEEVINQLKRELKQPSRWKQK